MRGAISGYELIRGATLEAVLDLLGNDGGWRPIAGGTDLMVLFNAGKLPHRQLVSIRELPELRGIDVADGHILIGAAAPYTEIRSHRILQVEFPLLCQAASWTGSIANQNRGTLGGNIANASPAADSAPMLLVYDAELELSSLRGARWVSYANFHLAYKTMQLRTDELITRIRLSRRRQEPLQYARKVGTRRAQAISKVCFAAIAEHSRGTLQNVRIAVGSVAPTPLRCYLTEGVLQGRPLTDTVIAAAEKMLRQEIAPISDIRSTSEYRAQVSVNLLNEFLEKAR